MTAPIPNAPVDAARPVPIGIRSSSETLLGASQARRRYPYLMTRFWWIYLVGLVVMAGAQAVLAAVLPAVSGRAIGALVAVIVIAPAVVVYAIVRSSRPPLRIDPDSLELLDERDGHHPASAMTGARVTATGQPGTTVLILTDDARQYTIVLETARRSPLPESTAVLLRFLEASAISPPLAAPDSYDPRGRFAHITGDGGTDRAGAIAAVRRAQDRDGQADAGEREVGRPRDRARDRPR